MNISELSEQEILRRQSLSQLREMGIDPYPAAEFPTNAFSTDIRQKVDSGEWNVESEDATQLPQVSIAGRLMSRRIMGKASFIELQDSKGRIQVYVTRDDICPDENKDLYNVVFKKLLDIGDFIGIKGHVFRTKTGETSVHAKELTLLSKSLKPLPIVKYKDGVAYDKFDDPELRYRQRYVDLVVNEGVKDTFLQRATVIRTLRKVLDEAGYTEVETPTLQSIAGGASARPFIIFLSLRIRAGVFHPGPVVPYAMTSTFTFSSALARYPRIAATASSFHLLPSPVNSAGFPSPSNRSTNGLSGCSTSWNVR